ncbi:hypothetical protein ACJX0J_006417, partial [Zea mays]
IYKKKCLGKKDVPKHPQIIHAIWRLSLLRTGYLKRTFSCALQGGIIKEKNIHISQLLLEKKRKEQRGGGGGAAEAKPETCQGKNHGFFWHYYY